MKDTPLVQGSSRQALTMATTGFFAGFAAVAVFGPLVPKFAALMHLSPTAAGLLAAIASLSGSILRIPFGAWADRGAKRPFMALLLLALIGMAGLIALLRADYPNHLQGTYFLLLLLGILVGSGIATFSVGIAQVSYWFPQSRQGGSLGTYAGLGNLGSGIFSLLLPLAVAHLGMIGAYEMWFLFLLIVTVLCGMFMKNAPSVQLESQGCAVSLDAVKPYGQDKLPEGTASHTLAEAAGSAPTWALVILYFTSFGGFIALTGWLPSFWHGAFHTTLVTGGALTLFFSVAASIVRVPGGLMADRFSIRYALSGNVTVMALGALVVLFSSHMSMALVGVLIMAVGMGLQNAIVFKLVPHYVPKAVGGAAGWVGGLGAFGGFVLPPVMGAVVGVWHNYHVALAVFLVLAVISWIVIGWLKHWDILQNPRSHAA